MQENLCAAISIGSNSVRLLIAAPAGGRLSALERLETVTRLGSYRSQEGGILLLEDDAMRHTRAAAETFAHHARERGAMLQGILATEAVRAAANGHELAAALEADLGVPVTVLSGEEEARLGWQTIGMGYEPGAHLVVIDIGGASTDLSAGRSGEEEPTTVQSLKLGVRTAMDLYDLDRPAHPQEVTSAVEAISAQIGERLVALRPQPEIAVVIGGTATVLAGLRHFSLDGDSWTDALTERKWLNDTLLSLASATLDRRVAAGVPRDRADVIVAGGAILLSVLEALDLHHFYVSERNILDGFIQRAIYSV